MGAPNFQKQCGHHSLYETSVLSLSKRIQSNEAIEDDPLKSKSKYDFDGSIFAIGVKKYKFSELIWESIKIPKQVSTQYKIQYYHENVKLKKKVKNAYSLAKVHIRISNWRIKNT